MSIGLEDLYPILFVLVWFVTMRYVLPRFGVRTWMSDTCREQASSEEDQP